MQKEYVEMQWLMLQQKKPDDYVISTGKQYSVKYFIELAFNEVGIKIKFQGKSPNTLAKITNIKSIKGYKTNLKVGDIVVKQSKKYLRPNEVDSLIGDSKKAFKQLGWKSRSSIRDICKRDDRT